MGVTLAKPHVDVGLMARDGPAMLAYWQEHVGLPFEELLPTGGGNHQHRHAMNGSVLKLNVARERGADAPPTGYAELWIASDDVVARTPLVDPDGNRVVRVPRGEDGVVGIAVVVRVRDAGGHAAFYERALGFEPVSPDVLRCGDSLFRLVEDADAPSDATIAGHGYRYVTLQVHDCDAATAHAIGEGATLAAPARTLGDVARFSMVRDPDGNWIELSQRKSLTGSLDAGRA